MTELRKWKKWKKSGVWMIPVFTGLCWGFGGCRGGANPSVSSPALSSPGTDSGGQFNLSLASSPLPEAPEFMDSMDESAGGDRMDARQLLSDPETASWINRMIKPSGRREYILRNLETLDPEAFAWLKEGAPSPTSQSKFRDHETRARHERLLVLTGDRDALSKYYGSHPEALRRFIQENPTESKEVVDQLKDFIARQTGASPEKKPDFSLKVGAYTVWEDRDPSDVDLILGLGFSYER